ncbi:mediator of RNA polymerase II transcription subunit 27 isoform X1 [Rhinopithecus roxellana]|uniref:mediator of RNA polymerase II transcription subunit 27 isoform X1 n=1 Tax=Rhinopithecus bieti TaxID=61621 RepID=UPI00083C2B4E|nr:PREDICTED: mediator of RNA polymerase II transcription subunit 27 isoform X1 [Rhinopithecus bieti]XP_030775798.1 mediator of RNA polymerase II transcription subunit 27 isoform X1 [Rhinopithecus roxellana]
MADVINVSVNLEAFSQAISAIQALRSSVSRVFDCLKDGMRNKETLEGREKAFIAHFQDNLHSVNRDLNELERLSNLVGKPSENHPLHNSGLLSLDPVQDKTPLYSQLLQAYKWSNKLQYHAGLASGLLNQQSLKRSANQMGVSAKRRPKAQPTTLVLPPQYVDDVINRIDRMFPEMSIQLSRPNGTSAMLLVTLGKVLKVIVVMRSLFIDRTIVKGYNENVYTEDGKLDIWSKSNYQVFQKKACLCPACFLYAGWEWPLTRLCPALSGNRPRHHCPAPLSAAPDAGRRGPILHDLVKKLHKAVPGPVPALREVSAGRPSPDVEGFPNPRSLP